MNAFGIHFLIIWRCFTIANVKKDDLPINGNIRVSELMVIGPNGEQMGTKKLQDALTLANYAGFDLVLMNPNGNPPVCKIMDYNKFKYEAKKKNIKFDLKKLEELLGVPVVGTIARKEKTLNKLLEKNI